MAWHDEDDGDAYQMLYGRHDEYHYDTLNDVKKERRGILFQDHDEFQSPSPFAANPPTDEVVPGSRDPRSSLYEDDDRYVDLNDASSGNMYQDPDEDQMPSQVTTNSPAVRSDPPPSNSRSSLSWTQEDVPDDEIEPLRRKRRRKPQRRWLLVLFFLTSYLFVAFLSAALTIFLGRKFFGYENSGPLEDTNSTNRDDPTALGAPDINDTVKEIEPTMKKEPTSRPTTSPVPTLPPTHVPSAAPSTSSPSSMPSVVASDVPSSKPSPDLSDAPRSFAVVVREDASARIDDTASPSRTSPELRVGRGRVALLVFDAPAPNVFGRVGWLVLERVLKDDPTASTTVLKIRVLDAVSSLDEWTTIESDSESTAVTATVKPSQTTVRVDVTTLLFHSGSTSLALLLESDDRISFRSGNFYDATSWPRLQIQAER